jgi:hypothetical protein
MSSPLPWSAVIKNIPPTTSTASNIIWHTQMKLYLKLTKSITFRVVVNWVSSCLSVCLSFLSWAPPLPLGLHIYFHCSYLYIYYNYYSRTLCIKCWVSAFHSKISLLCGYHWKRG